MSLDIFSAKTQCCKNIHCIAHRLALCSAQAAEKISYPKEFSEFLKSLFYYFKHSSNSVEGLKKVQEMLDKPALRVKEVYDVRWLAV